ncbi:hypothetical protein DPMN_140699 [Dreissena polymorpha]|uniref:Uncharacterized protein n=1 Tax=Dreissena polymorpha TaxID=45954 RepID=A0A9D4G874_DREPO|nr:hypothetical protein DPMN_140699 [Dreissena polymorpha]
MSRLSVHGNWATWNDWSICSVTCANGTVTRLRTCTDPAPVNGGNKCSGVDTEVNTCSFDPCPGTFFKSGIAVLSYIIIMIVIIKQQQQHLHHQHHPLLYFAIINKIARNIILFFSFSISSSVVP